VLFVPSWFIFFQPPRTLRNTKKRILSALCAFVVYIFSTTKNTKNHKEKKLSALRAFVVYFFLTTKKHKENLAVKQKK